MSDYVRCKHCGSILKKSAALAWRKKSGKAVVSSDFGSFSISTEEIEKAVEEALDGTEYEVDRSNQGSSDEAYGVFDIKVLLNRDTGKLLIGYFDGSTVNYEENTGYAAKDIGKIIDGTDIAGKTLKVANTGYVFCKDIGDPDTSWKFNSGLNESFLGGDPEDSNGDYVGFVDFRLI